MDEFANVLTFMMSPPISPAFLGAPSFAPQL
jgi:hypothetical protein